MLTAKYCPASRSQMSVMPSRTKQETQFFWQLSARLARLFKWELATVVDVRPFLPIIEYRTDPHDILASRRILELSDLSDDEAEVVSEMAK